MNIELFIVTYNNDNILSKTLQNLKDIDSYKDLDQVTIINNHSNFNINLKDYADNIRVLHNNCRPDFAESGFLSRNWNQAIILGFENLLKPKNDIVAVCQNDTIFKKDWVNYLKDNHLRYNFMTFGTGDQFCSYTVNAIRNIGLWDERFCNLHFQESDYFIRAILYNKDYSSINSFHRFRTNQIPNNVVEITETGFGRGENSRIITEKYASCTWEVFKEKWGIHPKELDKDKIYIPKCSSYILYQYFERDIKKETLDKQKYVYDFSGEHRKGRPGRSKINNTIQHRNINKSRKKLRIAICFYGSICKLIENEEFKYLDINSIYNNNLNFLFKPNNYHNINIFIHSCCSEFKDELKRLYKPVGSSFEEDKVETFSIKKVLEHKINIENKRKFKYDFVYLAKIDNVLSKNIYFNDLNNKNTYDENNYIISSSENINKLYL